MFYFVFVDIYDLSNVTELFKRLRLNEVDYFCLSMNKSLGFLSSLKLSLVKGRKCFKFRAKRNPPLQHGKLCRYINLEFNPRIKFLLIILKYLELKICLIFTSNLLSLKFSYIIHTRFIFKFIPLKWSNTRFKKSVYIFLSFFENLLYKKYVTCNKKENLNFMLEILRSIYSLKFYDYLYTLYLQQLVLKYLDQYTSYIYTYL